ncbi:MAG TPA: deaminase [Steroidobacteraceae bacterium]|nr:deaminase [Steroidobacteraceae bacterium]
MNNATAVCAAAMVHARVDRLVFGAWDTRVGAAGSVFNLVNAPELNHRVDAFGGVLVEECGGLGKLLASLRGLIVLDISTAPRAEPGPRQIERSAAQFRGWSQKLAEARSRPRYLCRAALVLSSQS